MAGIELSFVRDYKANIEMGLQQKQSRLRQAVTTGTYTGDGGKPVDQVEAIEVEDRTVRHAPTPLIEPEHLARWVDPVDSHRAVPIDSEDKLRMLVDPTSTYVQTIIAAFNRRIDRHIIGAFFATSKVGLNGGSTEAFDTATQQIAAGGTGLTVAKLRTIKQRLMAAEVDLDTDPIFMGITARQHTDLISETQIISKDYNERSDGKPVLSGNGMMERFLGINFIHSELFLATGTDRRCPVWVKSGMHLGIWNDIETRVGERADLGYMMQAYAKGTFGATRLRQQKVLEVLCTE